MYVGLSDRYPSTCLYPNQPGTNVTKHRFRCALELFSAFTAFMDPRFFFFLFLAGFNLVHASLTTYSLFHCQLINQF